MDEGPGEDRAESPSMGQSALVERKEAGRGLWETPGRTVEQPTTWLLGGQRRPCASRSGAPDRPRRLVSMWGHVQSPCSASPHLTLGERLAIENAPCPF